MFEGFSPIQEGINESRQENTTYRNNTLKGLTMSKMISPQEFLQEQLQKKRQH